MRARVASLLAAVVVADAVLGCAGCSGLREEVYRGEIEHLQRRGNEAYRAGDYDKAAERFGRIVEIAPSYAPALAALGNVALARGDGETASRRYRRAVALDPSLGDTLQPYLAYAQTVPASAGATVADLARSLASGAPALAELAATLADPHGWCAAARRAATPEVDAVSERLLELEGAGALEGCAPCTRLAAWWFAPFADPRHWALMRRALDSLDAGPEADELRYRLALSYERHMRPAAAASEYLMLLPDPRARERLARLRGE